MKKLMMSLFLILMTMFMLVNPVAATSYEGDYTACAKRMNDGKIIPKLFEINKYQSWHYVKSNRMNGFYSTDPEYAKIGRFKWIDAYTPEFWINNINELYAALPESAILEKCECDRVKKRIEDINSSLNPY